MSWCKPCLVLGALVLGCASSSVSNAPATTPVLPAPPPPEAREIRLALGADLARCHVEDPHFFYDGTRIRPQDRPALRQLATCLNEPGFSENHLLLVGHADPRGTAHYNDKLSAERAEQVKTLLVADGVNAKRITTRAAGDKGALVEPNASYGYDRRVDIVQLSFIAP